MHYVPTLKQWGSFGVAGALLLVALLVSACSDDPILGPDDGAPDDSGGSYSVIKKLAPTDTAAVPDSAHVEPASPSPSRNPERF